MLYKSTKPNKSTHYKKQYKIQPTIVAPLKLSPSLYNRVMSLHTARWHCGALQILFPSPICALALLLFHQPQMQLAVILEGFHCESSTSLASGMNHTRTQHCKGVQTEHRGTHSLHHTFISRRQLAIEYMTRLRRDLHRFRDAEADREEARDVYRVIILCSKSHTRMWVDFKAI